MDKKKVTFLIDASLLKDIKFLAVETERSLTDLYIEALKDLLKKLEDMANEVYKGKEKNLIGARAVRKDIARIKTVINEKKFLKENINA